MAIACSAHVEVGGKFEVSGALTVQIQLEVLGSTDVGRNCESAHVRISGKFMQTRCYIKEEADISGKLEIKRV